MTSDKMFAYGYYNHCLSNYHQVFVNISLPIHFANEKTANAAFSFIIIIFHYL